MVTRERLLAIALTLIMVTAAGCAGWGTDGPTDDQDQDQGNGDDLEEADGEAQADEGNGNDGSSSGANDSDSDSDSSQDSSSQASDTDTADNSTDSKETDTTVGDQDESTDETGQTGNDDSDSSTDSDSDGDTDSDTDTDSDRDSDTGDGDGDTDQDDGDKDTVEETEHTLKVTVVDEDGNPIEGASVHATGPVLSNDVAHEPAGETNADGVAMLTAYDGEYGVEAQHDGTTTDKKTVVVDGDTETMITIDTSPDEDPSDGDDDAPYGTLTVTVKDSSNEPVDGVEVVGIGPEGEIYSATTDVNGQATFDLSDGKYTYYVSTDGTEYADSSEEEITMDGSDQAITLTVQADDGDETNTLTVNLANEDVDGVEIKVWRAVSGDEDPNRVTKESENGQATFELEPGHYYADAEGYVGTLSSIDVTEDDVEITLQNRSGAAVPVKVTDAETGEPIAGAEISGLCHLNYSTGEVPITGTTGEDGVAQAHADVTPAWCTGVQISADGYEDAHTDINVPTEETVTVEVTPMEKNGNGGEEQHQLTVNALDHENNPLPDATVSVVTYDGGADVGSATTNGDGVATFDVEDGDYEVSVSHDDYQADGIDGPVNVRGEDTTVDVSMPEAPGEKNRLTVNLANDDIDGVAVTAEREGPDVDPDPVTKASAGGQVTFRLDPGYYHVSANEYNDTQVAIDVTEDNEITLQKTDAEPVTFTVTDAETSDPIEGAEVSGECDLWYSSGDVYIEGDGTTNENGVIEAMPGVTPTDCNPVRVTADGYEPTDVSVSVPADQTVTVELTPKQDSGEEQYQLSVNALDHEGNPLPNATVSVVTYDGGQDVAGGTTNQDGVATFDLGNGSYEVSVTHEAYQGAEAPEPFEIQGEDHSIEVKMTNPDDNGDGNTDTRKCSTFDSYDDAQAYFEQAPLDDERSERDKDNDGVACESLGPSPDAKAIVIVEDQNGERVANLSVTIDGEETRTNEYGVASRGYDFHNGTGSKEITVVVQDEETTMTVATEKGATLDKESNIVEVTAMTAVAQDSQTSLAAAVV